MSRDRSLDEFGGEDESTEADADVDSDSDAEPDVGVGSERGDDASADDSKPNLAESSLVESDLDGVEPAVATYRWDPDGVECLACGEVVERLWTREGDLVCADCKEW